VAELSQADTWTDGWTDGPIDITKPTVAFRKYFANTPKNCIFFLKNVVMLHGEMKLGEMYEITVGWTPDSQRETKKY
jgi:hypothetical protein